MKTSELKRLLIKAGCYYLRDGGRHELWVNPKGERFAIPRHSSQEVSKGVEMKAKRWAGI